MKDTKFYTHIDFAYGFWQVGVREEDVHETAFKTPNGVMEWATMPFGLCNAPFTFQRMMTNILRGVLHNFVTICLDDVCVYSRTLEEHLERMRLVLQRFMEA
jgi:hypothetical protein